MTVDHLTPSCLSGSNETNPALPHKGGVGRPSYPLYIDPISHWLLQTRLSKIENTAFSITSQSADQFALVAP
ncbi:hypothetical protein Hamer_G013632 [Homarus americanus]|uniref:Uncharacterized protein n=1 Tax=Homarus americanus TaxID=6706 RepID=A0A8J5K399_HOMAM|nr:hypothetical protein Hamer_G013632 [Homarus americanus]